MRNFSPVLAFAACLTPFAHALNTIEVKAQEFVDSATGNRFEIIGIDYQPGGSAGYEPTTGMDPLSNPTDCLRDAALMQQLGINTIRIYSVDPYVDHDQCVSIFNQAGIYILLDVNSPLPNESINQDDPVSSYNSVYLNRTFAVLDAFSGYPNTLGFISANELVYQSATAKTDPPYIRAVTRDLKQYMQARGTRQVPVGYAAADVRNILVDTSNYVQCSIGGSSAAADITSGRSDFFGLNSYSWCGDATFESSTYNQLVADFLNTTIPVFFTEYGCIYPEPRTFTEVPTLYGTLMKTWSGGLVYQWTQETNGYGLVQVNSDASVTLLQDYNNLQTQFNALDLSLIESSNTTATSLTPPACAAALVNSNGFSTDFTLPAQPAGVSSLIKNGAPGARTGSIVSVTSTAISVVVTPVSGAATSSLSISSVSSANTPAGASGSATSTAAGAATSTSSKGAAAAGATGAVRVVGAGVAGVLLMMI